MADSGDLRLVACAGVATDDGERPDLPPSTEFTMPWWHSEEHGSDRGCMWLSATTADMEVARLMLEPRVDIDPNLKLQMPTAGFLEIVFLEVSISHRRSRVGTRVVSALTSMANGRRLIATSQDKRSDTFWDALGWIRHEHPFFRSVRPVYAES